MIRFCLTALAVAAALLSLSGASAPGWRWRLPAGVASPPVPPENPMTAAKAALGRRLFYDGDLSIDGTMSCATCHEQKRGFADGNRTRPGVHGEPGRRNVPGLANVAWLATLTWANPTLTTLETQALVPILGEHPVEMGMKGAETEIARRLGKDGCYIRMFQAAFPETGGAIDIASISKTLAAFERTLVSFDSPYDRKTLSSTAKRGEAVFRQRCATCHSGPNFTDGKYHAIAPPSVLAADQGVIELTGLPADKGRFRTPSLRNVAMAAPYLHDGSAATLADAIWRHASVERPDAAGLGDLTAFIQALTDRKFTADPRFSLPRKACGRFSSVRG